MAKKNRATIPTDVAAQALFLSDRTCCVCRRPKRVQIHHIDEDPSNNALENLAVLCFDCHTETQIRGGFDRKLDAAQIVLYRDQWLATVAQQRGEVITSYHSLLAATPPVLPSAVSANVVAARPWHTRIGINSTGALAEQSHGNTIALIAPFRNDATADHPVVSVAEHLVATVRLSSIPDSLVTGHWLGSSFGYVPLRPGEQRLLVVAVIGPQYASLVSDSRRGSAVEGAVSGEVEFKHFWFRPSIVTETDFTVSLSNAGHFLGEHRYLAKLSPFPDIQFGTPAA